MLPPTTSKVVCKKPTSTITPEPGWQPPSREVGVYTEPTLRLSLRLDCLGLSFSRTDLTFDEMIVGSSSELYHMQNGIGELMLYH